VSFLIPYFLENNESTNKMIISTMIPNNKSSQAGISFFFTVDK